jgi:hypothetical protein
VKQTLQDMIEEQQKLKTGLSSQSQVQTKITVNFQIPNNMGTWISVVGLVIGKNGETIKSINQRSGAYVFIPPEVRPGDSLRPLSITGLPVNCEKAQKEIMDIVQLGVQNLEFKTQPVRIPAPFPPQFAQMHHDYNPNPFGNSLNQTHFHPNMQMSIQMNMTNHMQVQPLNNLIQPPPMMNY